MLSILIANLQENPKNDVLEQIIKKFIRTVKNGWSRNKITKISYLLISKEYFIEYQLTSLQNTHKYI